MKRFVILAVTMLALSLGPGLLRSQNPQEIDGIAKARVDAAEESFRKALGQLSVSRRAGGTPPPGGPSLEEVYLWSRRWMEAERDWKTEKTVAVKAHVQRMKDLERVAFFAYEKSAVKFYRLEVELWLAKAEKPGK